jgi:hypothetical protein
MGVRPLRGDSTRGLAPLYEWARQAPEPSLRGREAYLKQYVDRPSGEPACLGACQPHRGASPPCLRGRAPIP